MTVCEQCGNAIGLRFLDTRLAWVHLAPGSEGAYWVLDHAHASQVASCAHASHAPRLLRIPLQE